MSERKIIHIDMDAFFASVEQRDHPELRNIPIAVGYDGPRGVVSTASYEARKFGVHSAMSITKAKRLCPHLTVVSGSYDNYRKVSHEIRAIFHEYTDFIEPLSLDEAFLDVTENKKNMPYAVDIANEIRAKIRERLHLTASAGVSYNKFLAKVASDYRKPDGITVIPPAKAIDFINKLKIEKFWGVGTKTAEKMHYIGIFNGKQLRECSREHLIDVFGKAGNIFYNFARGIDYRPVITDYTRKSVGCEHTFLTDIDHKSTLIIELYHTVLELEKRINKIGFEGYTLTLKIKFEDFTQITRSFTQGKLLKTKEDLLPIAKKLLKQVDVTRHTIRLMGLSVSNPKDDIQLSSHEYIQLELDFKE